MYKKLESAFSSDLNIEKAGFICFLLGIFLLASAVGISIIFFLISLIISFLKPKQFLKDKWNYPFFLCTIMMFLSTLIHFKKFGDFSEFGLNPLLSLIGLVNWIPFFLFFWGFQQYLSNEKKRTLVGKFFIYGSIPVIFSGILQNLPHIQIQSI